MALNAQDYTALFQKLLQRGLSEQDTLLILDWLGAEVPDVRSAELIWQQLNQYVPEDKITPELRERLDAKLPHILIRDQDSRVVPLFRRKAVTRIAAAAVVLLMLAGAAVWFNRKPVVHAVTAHAHKEVSNDIAPGMAGAILTLDDGRKVVLDSAGNGVIATQSGARIVLKNGELVYDASGKGSVTTVYNTMSTPKGRQFRLVLPDGTQVWLNAASSLRYPVIFTGRERMVEVTGEAYFEVAKVTDPVTGERTPFKVKVNNNTSVEVLGTHFNINSYEEEANISTTLLEGSVRLHNNGNTALLKPGQQALIALNGVPQKKIAIVEHADVDKVMAWKNGVFNFQDATLDEVMRQLERWYNIEVVYERGIPKQEFIGKMGRDLPLSDVLRGLEMSKVHFRLEQGRRVVVLP